MSRRGMILTGLILGGLLAFLVVVKSILLPFIIGFVLAYLLNPVVNWLEKECRMPREVASALPVTLAVVLLITALATGIPLLIEQLQSFVQRLPVYLMMLEHFVLPTHLAHYVGNVRENLTLDSLLKTAGVVGTKGIEFSIGALQRGYSGIAAALDAALLVIMTPLVAFYLLLDWPQLKEQSVGWLPKRWQGELNDILAEIHVKLGAYLRGMMLVMGALGSYYALGLSLLGLELGWAIGILTGLLAFLPIIGFTIGVTTMFAVALVQYQLLSWQPYAVLAGICVLGQILENTVLTPKLVGHNIGLHPLWVLFALLAGSAVAGITGTLVSLPVAVVISVVLPRILRAWQKSV